MTKNTYYKKMYVENINEIYSEEMQDNYQFGKQNEKEVFNYLKKYFFPSLEENWNENGFFDFIDTKRKLLIELKSVYKERHYNSKEYKMPKSKLDKYENYYKENGYKFILIYNLNGLLIYINLTKNINYRIELYGRLLEDGTQLEPKEHIIIPRHKFIVHSALPSMNFKCVPLYYYL